jgi:acetyl-CoA acetyltransferase
MASTRTLRGAAAIVGAVDDVSPTGVLGRRGRELEIAMVEDALADAGLDFDDVDGLCYAGYSPMAVNQLAEELGLRPTYIDGTFSGGSSYEVHVEHAAAAIAAGLCEVVVSVYAQTPRGDRRTGRGAGFGGRRAQPAGPPDPSMQWQLPHGLNMPIGPYALAAIRHMHEYGTTPEQLAQIAVSTRAWAARNPRACEREPITVDDVLGSPLVASPLHKLDCCLVSDGAGAFVMTSADRAADLRQPPVYVLGAATAVSHNSSISEMADLTATAGAVSGPKAFAMAGITPDDVDLLMGYDSFTITQLLHLEDLGFCAKGEGGALVEDGRLGPGGSLPTNTNGGGLSYTHPGMYGIFLIVEAVRQLRGQAEPERQLDHPEVAVCHGSGGILSVLSTIVLGTGR